MHVRGKIKATEDVVYGEILPQITKTAHFDAEAFIDYRNIMWVRGHIVPPRLVTVYIYPYKDSFVWSPYVWVNYGHRNNLALGNTSAGLAESFMGFRLNQIPEGLLLEKAVLRIHNNRSILKDVDVKISRSGNNWTETGITWLNKPDEMYDIETFLARKQVGYQEIDITDYISSWYENNYSESRSFTLNTQDDDMVYYGSRESSNKPYLMIQYYETHKSRNFNIISSEILPQINDSITLNSEIYVSSNYRTFELESEIEIIDYPGDTEFEGEVHASNIGEVQVTLGEVEVLKIPSDVEFEGEVLPRNEGESSLDCEVDVAKIFTDVELECEILPNAFEEISLECEVDVAKIFSDVEFECEILPFISNSVGVESEIYINLEEREIEIECEILPFFEKSLSIDSEVEVSKKLTSLELEAEIHSRDMGEVSLACEVEISNKLSSTEFEAEIAPEVSTSFELDCEVEISKKPSSSELEAEILIYHQSPVSFDAEIDVLLHDSYERILSEIEVSKIPRTLIVQSEILPRIKEDVEFDGEVDVVKMPAERQFEAEVLPHIRQTTVMYAEIDIREYTASGVSFRGEVLIESGTLAEGRSYGFIM